MAIHSAAEKLEKQAVKARTKWRDNRRTPRKSASEAEIEAPAPEVEVEAEEEATPERRVFHVGHHKKRKPMTLEEALLEMETRDYVVYLDAETDGVNVLVRRRDGHFDLIEA
jgi:putative sigma-54 modulation protein